MAVGRVWLVVHTDDRDAAQTALDGANLGTVCQFVTPFPTLESPQVYVEGLQTDVSVIELVESTLDGTGLRVRHWRGPVRPSNPAMSAEDLIALFPEPDSGPPPLTVVTRDAALAGAYRDFGLGAVPSQLVAPAAGRGRP